MLKPPQKISRCVDRISLHSLRHTHMQLRARIALARAAGTGSVFAISSKTISTAAGPTPITTLSGFLGTGKTTVLKHILENKAGLRIAVIVNDLAAVNIDAALLLRRGGGSASSDEGVLELQNGCVCCSDAAELLTSIEKLQQLAASRGAAWDHIVIESSGVAEPREIRNNLREALATDPDALNGAALSRMVTVVDASTFLQQFERRQAIGDRPDLGGGENVPMPILAARRQVVDLMCEQVECADIVILNKADLVSSTELQLLTEAVARLNPHAAVLATQFGQVDPASVLSGGMVGGSVASLDIEREQWRLVQLSIGGGEGAHGEGAHGESEHGHGDGANGPGHSECAHAHGECGHEHGERQHGHGEHGHGHGSGRAEADGGGCTVAGCSSHAHSHGHAHHQHSHSRGREAERFGITSFCYRRRRPFHPRRLMGVLQQLPAHLDRLALSAALQQHEGADEARTASGHRTRLSP